MLPRAKELTLLADITKARSGHFALTCENRNASLPEKTNPNIALHRGEERKVTGHPEELPSPER